MPDTSGIELCLQLRSRGNDALITVIRHPKGSHEFALGTTKADAHDYAAKPFK